VSDFHDAYRRQLVTAAGSLFEAPRAARKLEPRRPRRVQLVAIIALGALLLAAAAFGATQIIGFGAPVAPAHAPGREHVSRTTGVGLPVASGEGSPASAQPLAIFVPDPRGGLPWGMRVVRTTRGLLCPQIGRLLDGRLGVLGQDGEFNDDGLFHELPASVLEPNTCITPSAWSILSEVGVPAAGALQSPATSCVAPWLRASRSSAPRCPAGDERLIGFGLLGPDAVSVSYMADGRLHTVATAGRLGAYLVVLPVPAKLAQNVPALGGKGGLLGGFPIGAGRGEVVARLMFRFDGRLCQTGFDREPGGPPQCTTQLAAQRMLTPTIPHGLHTPVALRARRAPGGYELQLAFTAPAAVRNASIAYGVQVTRPSSPACGRGGIWGQSIERDIARGQRLHVSEFVPQPPGCHGIVSGRVVLGAQPVAASTLGSRDETIGRFSFAMR
jgi:hypothetical protein